MPGLLESAGAQVRNPSRGKPIHIARMETGLFTNRSPLHDPADFIVSKFYGGYVDALIDGSNMEVTNQLTLARRPGLSKWSSIAVPDPPNWFYNWRTLDCGVKVVVDTPVATYLQTATTQTQIFTKTVGAGQGYYQGVGDTLYVGDGIDLQKFILNTSTCTTGTVWNWGIIAPTVMLPASPAAGSPVGIVITQSNASAVNWTGTPATVWSTMGLLIDSNNNIQQLISVNSTGTNQTRFGMTGSGNPDWNPMPGGATPDPGGWNWSNWGPIVPWSGGKTFNNASVGGTIAFPCIIYDPKTACCFINAAPALAQGTTGASYPNFPAGFGQSIHDGSVKWFNLGSLKTPPAWQALHTYPALGSVSNDDSVSGISEPVQLSAGLPSSPVIYWQVNNTGAPQTSGASGTHPQWSQTLYSTTNPDGDLIWLNLGSATRTPNSPYTAWTKNLTGFSVIVDPNNNFQVCTRGGTSSAAANGSIPWATVYGQRTLDSVSQTDTGQVVWTCVGKKMTWVASTQWYLPAVGWFPPGGSVKYGGAIIVDSNNNLQGVIESGLGSAGAHPVWKTFPPTSNTGAETIDNQATWALIAPNSTAGFATQFSHTWAYSYASRLATDPFNTTSQPLLNPPQGVPPLGPPTGSGSGHISTASPVTLITGPNAGAVYTLTIPGSPDPQVDTIIIWRTLDGGSDLFFLGEIHNAPPINGIQQYAKVTDATPDTGLNEFEAAPINHQNDPPPAGFLPMAFHFERIWGAVGNFVFASGGPDVLTGNPNEAFNPEDFFEFPSPVTKIVPTATGILVFLTSDVYAILGGPLFATFFPTPMVPGIGLLHFNALHVEGAVSYLYTADNQLLSMDPSGGVQRMGGPIADKLQAFDATKTFVTVHESGNDNCIIVSDGTNGWYRLNPSQFPTGKQVWSPFANITNGAGAVLSIEVTRGVHRLLVGGIHSNDFILQRDFSTHTDNGAAYPCFFTMGSINLVNPGQIAGLTFVNIRATRVGTSPICSFLLNEISGAFTTFPQTQAYPWQIYGATLQPTSLFSNSYYFRATGVPALAEHLQIKVAFPSEDVLNEVISLSIFGTVEQSPEE